MVRKWVLGLGLAALLLAATSVIAHAGVSIRFNIGVPVKRFHSVKPFHHTTRFHHFHPVITHPRVLAPAPIIVVPGGVVHRPIWIPGRWQWTPRGWYWAGGYWVK